MIADTSPEVQAPTVKQAAEERAQHYNETELVTLFCDLVANTMATEHRAVLHKGLVGGRVLSVETRVNEGEKKEWEETLHGFIGTIATTAFKAGAKFAQNQGEIEMKISEMPAEQTD
jgi:hypothetical protein